ncbi:MAG: LLM class flavin-dependent oxidoreductase [Stellaceae bacterium]
MKFTWFNLMPWPYLPDDFREKNRSVWVDIDQNLFDPAKSHEVYNTYMDLLEYAGTLGFDGIGVNEHHQNGYGIMPSPNIIAAGLARRTKDPAIVVLGNSIALYNPPIRVAEEFAMLDVISGGRLIAGFMRGIPHEYVAYNVPPSESFGRMLEASELIRKAWSQPQPFGWEGKYYQFRAVSIWPRPVQQPGPRVLMSGSTPESARFAAQNHAKLGIVRLTDLESVRDCIRVYKEAAAEAGWTPEPDDILIGQYTSIAETEAEAKKNLEGGIDYFLNVLNGGIRTAAQLVLQKTRYYTVPTAIERTAQRVAVLKGMSIEERVDKGLVLCGTPDQVVKQIKTLHRELGMGVINVVMKVGNVPNDAIHRGMTLFKNHVVEHVRDL